MRHTPEIPALCETSGLDRSPSAPEFPRIALGIAAGLRQTCWRERPIQSVLIDLFYCSILALVSNGLAYLPGPGYGAVFLDDECSYPQTVDFPSVGQCFPLSPKYTPTKEGLILPETSTKAQIIAWLTSLIDHGEPAGDVLEALSVLEQFITWWQVTHGQPWNPWRWTLADDRVFLTTMPSEDCEQVWFWLPQFRQWLVDEGVLPNDGDLP